jgi:hypothetical protein
MPAVPQVLIGNTLGLERRLPLLLWGLLVLAVAFSFWGTIGKPDAQDLDLGAYYRAAVAVNGGQSPYVVDEHGPMGSYPYAPVYAFLMVPLQFLEYLWAVRLWMVLNWLATAAVFVLATRIIWGPGQTLAKASWALPLAVLPTVAYVWANLRVGQAAMLMTMACLGWVVSFQRGRPFCGGLFLAVACALKLAPGILLPYLFLRRDWRGLAGMAVGGMCLFLLPAVWVGWERDLAMHQEWVKHMAATQVPVQTYRPGNQSLLAQLARLPAVSNGHICFSPDNLAALSAAYPLLVAVLAAGIYFWIWRQRRTAGNQSEQWHLAILFVFMTLANPRAWRCNFVALIFPCLLLAEHIVQRRRGFRMGVMALCLVLLACIWPTDGLGEEGWSLTAWLLQGKHFWGAVAVATVCVWLCGNRASEEKSLQSRSTCARWWAPTNGTDRIEVSTCLPSPAAISSEPPALPQRW